MNKLTVTLQDTESDRYKRMFEAACVDLGRINACLGLDPDDGGAEPIIEAIKELRASVGAAIYRICKLVGIDDLHLHDLRHEGVSRLFEAGLDIPRVAMISGHQSWATLRRYTHLKPGDVVARMQELASAT
jgi:integrase